MKTSIRTFAALCALGLGLAGTAAAQEPVKPKPGGPVPVPYPNRPAAPMAKQALTPEAAELRAKLVKAQADLAALASQPAPPNLSPRDAAALQEQQAADRRLAQKLQDLTGQLDAGQSRSDIGQQLQLALQEANNVYTRSTKAQSAMSSAHNKTADAIVQNLR